MPRTEQTIYTLRHAAIDFGRQRIIAGRLNPPINAEGVEPSQLETIEPATYYVRVGDVEHSLNPPGGETLEQLRDRAIAFHELVRSIEVKDLLIVSHGTFLQQYHGYLRGFDVYHSLNSSVSYLQLNKFSFEGEVLTSDERVYRAARVENPW